MKKALPCLFVLAPASAPSPHPLSLLPLLLLELLYPPPPYSSPGPGLQFARLWNWSRLSLPGSTCNRKTGYKWTS